MTKCDRKVITQLNTWPATSICLGRVPMSESLWRSPSPFSNIVSSFFFFLTLPLFLLSKVVLLRVTSGKIVGSYVMPTPLLTLMTHHFNFSILDGGYEVIPTRLFLLWCCLPLRHLWRGRRRRCLGRLCTAPFLILGFVTAIPLSMSKIRRRTEIPKKSRHAIIWSFILSRYSCFKL